MRKISLYALTMFSALSTTIGFGSKVYAAEEITVNVNVYDYTAVAANLTDASETGVIMEEEVTVLEGTSTVDVVKKAFEQADVDVEGIETGYISSVNGLDSTDGGGYSGWMMSYNNDDYSNWGMSYVTVADGDVLRFDYSCNEDTTTDLIGTGSYGLPIVKEFTVDGETVTMKRESAYDANWNMNVTYYINDEVTEAAGTSQSPFVLDIVLDEGTDLTDLDVSFSTSLDEHYQIVSGLSDNMDFSEKVEFTVSTLGGKSVAYYVVNVTIDNENESGTQGNEQDGSGSGTQGNEQDGSSDGTQGNEGQGGDISQDEEETGNGSQDNSEQGEDNGVTENKLSDKAKSISANTNKYILNTVTNPTVSSAGGEWAVLALARGNVANDKWYNTYYNNLVEVLKMNESNVLSSRKSTENSRVVIALNSIGKDATDVAGYNLIQPLADYDYVIKQGINGPAYAIIALQSGKYTMPKAQKGSTQASFDMYIDYILERELENGGFALAGDIPDVDVTAMVIQALSFFYDEKHLEVVKAVDRAVEMLSNLQRENGGYISNNEENPSGCAQVICALSLLGIDADKDARFVKQGNSVVDALLANYDEKTGAFAGEESKINLMLTEQAAYALDAYVRLLDNKSALYEMDDVEEIKENVDNKNNYETNSNDSATNIEKADGADTKDEMSVRFYSVMLVGIVIGMGVLVRYKRYFV